MVNDPKFIDGMFDAVMQSVSQPQVSKLISTEQKQTVLDALNVSVEEVNDSVVKVSYLFMVITVDMTNEDNPQINMGFDMNALVALST